MMMVMMVVVGGDRIMETTLALSPSLDALHAGVRGEVAVAVEVHL
jgi:hypothetical protein